MKLSKKILSVILAVLMAFSTFAVTLSASAAEAAKPEYTEKVTKEDITKLFEDADKLLLTKVLKGSVIESIFKALPGLSIIGTDFTNVEFYNDGIWSRTTTFGKIPQTGGYGMIPKITKVSEATDKNKERFADLKEYGDGVVSDNVPENMVEYFGDIEGRYNQGKIVQDQAEQQATDEVRNPDGTVTPAKPYQPAVEGTFTRFFKEHPIEVNSLDDFKDEINNVIATVLMDKLGLVSALGGEYLPDLNMGGNPQALYDIFAALDDVCAGLGIEQDKSSADIFVSWNYKSTEVVLFPTQVWKVDENGDYVMNPNYPERHEMTKYDGDAVADATVYLQKVVNALFDGGLVKNVVGALQNLADAEHGARFYKGIALIIDALNRAVDCPFGGNLGVKKNDDGSLRYTGIAKTIKDVYKIFNDLPTINDGTQQAKDAEGKPAVDEDNKPIMEEINKRLNMDKLIPAILDIVGGAVAENVEVRIDKDEFEASYDNADYIPKDGKTITLIFKPMAEDLAKVAAAESPEDAVKFVVDYLYDVVLKNKYNNNIVYSVFDGMADSFITIPDDIKEIGKDIVDPADDDLDNVPKAEDELLTMALSLVGEMVDHHINLQAVEVKDATCTEQGYKKDCYYCPDCKNYFETDNEYAAKDTALKEEDVVIAPAGHVFGDEVEAKTATYFEEGNIAYKPCTVCGKTFALDAEKTDDAIDITVPKFEGTLGNVDNEEDGKITPKDVLMAMQFIAKFKDVTLDDVQFALADVNGDRKVNAADVLQIKQKIAGTEFPALQAK